MRLMKEICLALACGLVAAVSAVSSAQAISCPPVLGTSSHQYTIVGAAGCALGSEDNITISGPFAGTSQFITLLNGSYYAGAVAGATSPPATALIPAGVQALADSDNPGGFLTGLVNTTSSGTITFLQAITDVFLAIKNGNDPPGPSFAVFALGSVLAGSTFDWSITPQGSLSHFVLWGNPSAVPLPPAALLFGTALVGLGFLARGRRKKGAA
jgi:hypothetical protein